MSKIKLLLIVLTAILLAGNVQSGFGGRGGSRAESTVAVFPEVAPDGTASQDVIDELVATVQSDDAAMWEKRDALRQLNLVGNEATVPVIAALLGDPDYSHMARYALQAMPYSSVDTAFRNALGKLDGLQLAGVIHSIGIRGDTEAVPQLTKLLSHSNAEVLREAAMALGHIGNDASAKALRGVVANAEGAFQNAVCEGLFRCADSLGGNTAIEIYDQVRGLDTINSVRTGAIRGAILARGNNGVQLLQEYLTGDDYTGFVSAVRTSQEMTASGTTKALLDAMSGLSADNQILIMSALGKRGDTAAVPALLAMIKNTRTEKSVRVEAIRILPQLPDASSVPVLMGLLTDSDSDIVAAAETAIATMPGQDTDKAVIAMLDSRQTNQRLAAIEMIGRRRITSSIPDLVEAAGDSNQQIRQASIRQIGELGTLADLDTLLDLALNLRDSADMDAAINAISNIFADAEDPQAYARQLIGRLEQAQPAQKSALLRVLSVVGGSEALTAVRAAVNDSNAQVRNAAIQSISDWPDYEAIEILLDLAADRNMSLTNYVLSLRGAARLIRENIQEPLENRVEHCLSAYNVARRDEERREVISVMATLRSIEIGEKLVEIATENEALRNEAGLAAIQVAQYLYTGRAAGGGGRGGMMGGGRGGMMGGDRGGARGARGGSSNAISPNSSLIISSIAPIFAAAAGGGRGGQQGGMMGGFGGRGRAPAVTVTDEERAAAVAIAEKILALNISEDINVIAQNIIDGTIGATTGRGGMMGGDRGGMMGGDRGGMMGGERGARGGERGGMTGGDRGGARGQ